MWETGTWERQAGGEVRECPVRSACGRKEGVCSIGSAKPREGTAGGEAPVYLVSVPHACGPTAAGGAKAL